MQNDLLFSPQYNNANYVDVVTNYMIKNLTDNENLCKLLLFDGEDALMQTFTSTQKKGLTKNLNINSTDPTDSISNDTRRIFIRPFVDLTQNVQRCELRIYPIFRPMNNITTKINFLVDIVCHSKVSDLYGNRARPVALVQEVLNSLNGKNIEGAQGKFILDDDIRVVNYGNYYTGYRIVFSTFSAGGV